MAIHYNLTLVYDKWGQESEQINRDIHRFVHDLPNDFEVIKQLIEEKNKPLLLEKVQQLTIILTNFGIIHAHETGEALINWTRDKRKRREALALYDILLKHYKLARKEIKKDYNVNSEKV